jgi:hypothetical protein
MKTLFSLNYTWSSLYCWWNSNICTYSKPSSLHPISPKFVLILFCVCFLGRSGTESTITEATTGLVYQPRMVMDNDCGTIGAILGRESRSTRRKRAPVPLCPPQIPYDLTRTLTRAAAVGSRWLTAWATALPILFLTFISCLRLDLSCPIFS